MSCTCRKSNPYYLALTKMLSLNKNESIKNTKLVLHKYYDKCTI